MINKDIHGRFFDTLRISLLDKCNLACTYCTIESNLEQKVKTLSTLNYTDLVTVIKKLHALLNFSTIRLTGGEPTLYKNLIQLIKDLKVLNTNIKITTNGILLKNLVENIGEQDLQAINVSLDTTNEALFYKISKRTGLNKVIEGIDAALKKNIKVNINCVITKNTNETEIIPLLHFAKERNIVIRFLEIMNMGHLQNSKNSVFVGQADILEIISQKYSFKPLARTYGATANYWQTDEGQIFGIIANESSPFCADCNRLRLDSYGNIYGCLSNSQGFNVFENIGDDVAINSLLTKALAQKQPLKFTGSNMSMLNIGG